MRGTPTLALTEELLSTRRRMERHRAYADMRESGSMWLGELPAHWQVMPLRHLATSIQTGPFGSQLHAGDYFPGGIPLVNPIHLVRGTIRPDENSAVDDGTFSRLSRHSLQSGDIVFARRGEIGRCGLVTKAEAGWLCGTGSMRVRLDQSSCDPRFLNYFFNSVLFGEELTLNSVGTTMLNINNKILARMRLPLPPLPEQRAIAAFLDRQTAKIDALVEKKRRLIGLLKEKRAALISHAVTKGLDPNSPMKDSGIEWLGTVPAHWDVLRIGTISWVVRGASPRPAGDPTYFFGNHIPWVTVGELTKDSSKELYETATMLTEAGRRRSRLFRRGTLLLTNSGATLGVPKILAIDGCANDGVVGFLNLSTHVMTDFLYYYLFSLTEMFRDRIRQGCGQPNLNTDIVRATTVLLPPLLEQRKIVYAIERSLDRLCGLERKVCAAIDRLLEYRTALISAAVTGKIDVRNHCPDTSACPPAENEGAETAKV